MVPPGQLPLLAFTLNMLSFQSQPRVHPGSVDDECTTWQHSGDCDLFLLG